MARRNAERHAVNIEFIVMDVLQERLPVDQLDLIVSNPPYVTEDEKRFMESNVLDYEPHTALFVPNDNPLLFYSRIIQQATWSLKPGGRLYFEVNENFAQEVAREMELKNYGNVRVIADIHGKERFVRGELLRK